MSEIELCEYRRCVECEKCAFFYNPNPDSNSKVMYCDAHKQSDMVDIRELLPPVEYIPLGFQQFQHRGYKVFLDLLELLEISTKCLWKRSTPHMPLQCFIQDCKNPPLYNYPHMLQPIYCDEHNREGMIPINVYTRTVDDDYIYIRPSDYV